MKNLPAPFLTGCAASKKQSANAWVSLFDGKTLDGWRASERPQTFKVEDGATVANGPHAHLFYNGAVADRDFKNKGIIVRILPD